MNSAFQGLSSSPPYAGTPFDRLTEKALSFALYSPWPQRICHFVGQCLSFSLVLWRVIFVLAGVAYASLSSIGEELYVAGITRADLPLVQTAARVFPLNKEIRRGPGVYYSLIHAKGQGRAAIATLQSALADDPNAADFRRNLAGYYLEEGDIHSAEYELALVRKLVPKAQINVTVFQYPKD